MTKIMIVDDRGINREYLASLLKYYNFSILEAEDGKQAFEIISKELPNLVITDIIMPKMTGYELAQKMQNHSQLVKIPIIFYTAIYRVEEAAVLATKYRVKYVLSKPSDPDLIINTINKALRENKTEFSVNEESLTTLANTPISFNKKIESYVSDAENLSQSCGDLLELIKGLMAERYRLQTISDKFIANTNQVIKLSSRLFTYVEFNLDVLFENDINTLLSLYCKGARKIMDAAHCSIGIYQNNKLFYYFITDNKDLGPKIDERSEKNLQILYDTLQKHKLLKMNDLLEPSLILPSKPIIKKNFLGLLIHTSHTMYGFLYFTDKLGDFTDADVEIASALAAQFGLLYENILLNSQSSITPPSIS